MLKCDDRNGRSPSTGYDVIEYMEAEFGEVAVQQVHKGENVGWYLDQRLVSILVAAWIRQHGADRVKLVPRNIHADRSVTAFDCFPAVVFSLFCFLYGRYAANIYIYYY